MPRNICQRCYCQSTCQCQVLRRLAPSSNWTSRNSCMDTRPSIHNGHSGGQCAKDGMDEAQIRQKPVKPSVPWATSANASSYSQPYSSTDKKSYPKAYSFSNFVCEPDTGAISRPNSGSISQSIKITDHCAICRSKSIAIRNSVKITKHESYW